MRWRFDHGCASHRHNHPFWRDLGAKQFMHILTVNVTGTAAGQQNNTTSSVTSNEGGTGGSASASLSVVAPPAIAEAFNPAVVALNGISTVTFTLTNSAANVAG